MAAAVALALVVGSVTLGPRPAGAQTAGCIDYCAATATDALLTLQCAVLAEGCVCTGATSFTADTARGLRGGLPRGVAAATSSILPQTGQTEAQEATNREAPRTIDDDGELQVGAPFDFVANDNATVSDCVTNLMWEQKSADDGLHDRDDTYAWSDTLELTIWDFIEAMNGSCSDDEFVRCSTNADCDAFALDPGAECDGSACSGVPATPCLTNTDCEIRDSGTTCDAGSCSGDPHTVDCATNADCTAYSAGVCGYAGFQDWRIPNVKELMNLIDYGENGPNMQPQFDTNCSGDCSIDECSCTGEVFHWSSTTFEDLVTSAWAVGFRYGDVRGREKNSLRAVRAVRGPTGLAGISGCDPIGTTTTTNPAGTTTSTTSTTAGSATTTSSTSTTSLPPECAAGELELCGVSTPTATDALEVLLCATGLCPPTRGCSAAGITRPQPTNGATATSTSSSTSSTDTTATTATTNTLAPPLPAIDCGNPAAAVLPVTGQTQRFSADRFEASNQTVDDNGALQCGQAQLFSVRTEGTILDHVTCLVWEKKTDDGSVLHDKDDKYTWSSGGQLTIWDWVFRLNNRCDDDESVECLDADNQGRDCSNSGGSDDRPGGACGFAGNRDWRIPNVKELHSIINYGRSQPNLNTNAFNTECTNCAESDEECSCVDPTFHWSSTSWDARVGSSAWAVGFGFGDVRGREKDTPFAVRAVRGPLERDPDTGACIED